MGARKRVLVIGTTVDYIELISRRYPQRAVFVTDEKERAKSPLVTDDPAAELICQLDDKRAVRQALKRHLARYRVEVSGVACFDCESLPLAALIAAKMKLPFPSLNAILNCRSKYYSKYLWHLKGVPAPKMKLVRTWDDVADFWPIANGRAVMKPLTGSGSELVFLCDDLAACREAFETIQKGLMDRCRQRMYAHDDKVDADDGFQSIFVMEEFIGGQEYSCDFLLIDDSFEVIRVSQKLANTRSTFGTPLAYRVPGKLPPQWPADRLREVMWKAARVLGLKRAMGMIDFKICGDRLYLLELTPRPGGDCLPPLIAACCGLDMLGAQLDFAEGIKPQIPLVERWQPLLGVYVTAEKSGMIGAIHTENWAGDPRVKAFHLKRKAGDVVRMPPDDYDTRALGYVIFQPRDWSAWQDEALDMSRRLDIQYRAEAWTTKSF